MYVGFFMLEEYETTLSLKWNQFHFFSYLDLLQEADFLKEKYKEDILKVEEIGKSYDNRKILLFSIGSGGSGKKKILITAGVHGRETVNTIVCMRMIESYCKKIEEKEKTMEQYSFHIIPLLNPDGYMIAQKGFHVLHNEVLRKQAMRISKEKHIPYALWKWNGRGADINRDFPSKTWRPKQEGDYPGRQIETKAFMKVVNMLDTDLYLDLHSRGNEIYYYRKEMNKEYNIRQMNMAKKMAGITGYTLVNPFFEIADGDSGGNTVHYYSEHKKKPAFTIETVPEEESFPLSLQWQQDVYERIKGIYTVL